VEDAGKYALTGAHARFALPAIAQRVGDMAQEGVQLLMHPVQTGAALQAAAARAGQEVQQRWSAAQQQQRAWSQARQQQQPPQPAWGASQQQLTWGYPQPQPQQQQQQPQQQRPPV
jgi:hypothetical protein